MSDVTVGVDIGTTSIKALAVDPEGRVLARVRLPHRITATADRAEHAPGRVWRSGPRRALSMLAKRHGSAPAALSVAGMVPSLTAVDGRGIPRTPGLIYGDARGSRESVGRSGDVPTGAMAAEAAGFLAWSAGQLPHAHGYWPAQAVANHALCGRAVISTTVALSTLPLFAGPGWDPDRVAACGARVEQLPEIVSPGVAVGRAGETIVEPGSVDALCEQSVAGADHPGDVLVICGTTLVVWALSDVWRDVPGLVSFPHPSGAGTVIGGVSNAGGLFLDWAARLMGPKSPASSLHPERIPVWCPYIRGERTPWHDPRRRAAVVGLDLTHDSATVTRAAFEAAGFVVRHHLELAGVPARRIVATGGGSQNQTWLQALADCTGLPVDAAAIPEGAALGAAFLARVAAGLEDDVKGASRWPRTGRRVDPDPAWMAAAAARYATFRSLVGSRG